MAELSPYLGRQAGIIDISSSDRIITEMQKERCEISDVESLASGFIRLEHMAIQSNK